MLRYHGNGVDILTEKTNEDGEYIVLDKEKGTITLKVKNFSTYAFGYYQHQFGEWGIDEANHQHYKICSVCGEPYDRGSHVWKLQSTDETTGDRTYICECGAKEVVSGNKRNVSGTVKQNNGKPAAGAHVQLMQGDEVVAETTTDANGNYSFSGVEPGLYNVVVEYDESTVTVPAEVGEDKTGTETDNSITLPKEGVSTELKVKGEDTPNVVVDGLSKEAEAQQTDGSTVTLTMTVESKPENQATNAEDIRKKAGSSKELTFLELQIEKSVDGGASETLAETQNVLDIVIPFDTKDKENITVYRSYNGTVEVLSTTKNSDGEYIEVRDNAIVLHVKHFATYAIGYGADEQQPSQPGSWTPGETNRYPVAVQSGSHGQISTNNTAAKPGDRVTLTVTPDAGYMLDTLVVRDQNGNRITLTYQGGNTYTFIQPSGGVSVYATFAVAPQPGTSTPDPTPAPTTYSITLPEDSTGGTIAADPKSAAEGTEVTLTVKEQDGYHLDTITASDKDGKTIELKDNGDGTYTYTMPKGAVTVRATFVKCASMVFPDLDPTAWYHEHTDYVIAHDLMNGNDQGFFEPNGTVTRAQMVTLLWNLQGKPVVNYYMTFPDVDQEAWYTEAIRWATSEQVVSGYDSGSFGPNDTITREQMATMLYQYEQKYGDGGFTGTWMFRLPFTDLDQISDWAYEGTAWCYMNKVISGKEEDLFDPKGQATRAEMAAILTQYLKRD